jgi:hypothetical protein
MGKTTKADQIVQYLEEAGPQDIDTIWSKFDARNHSFDAAIQSAITDGKIIYGKDFKYHVIKQRKPRPPLPDGYGDYLTEEVFSVMR